MHVPFACAHTSGVEIRGDCKYITKAICDEELSSSSPRARAVQPSWFVTSAHSPQQTIGAPRAAVVSQPKNLRWELAFSDRDGRAGQGSSGRGENACVPFVDVGSLDMDDGQGRALLRASRASTRHDVSCPAASKCEPRARTVHTLRIAGRGWHISGLVGVATSTAVLGALVSLGCEETLSTSAVSYLTVWPAWTVCCCSLCPSPIRGGSYTHSCRSML